MERAKAYRERSRTQSSVVSKNRGQRADRARKAPKRRSGVVRSPLQALFDFELELTADLVDQHASTVVDASRNDFTAEACFHRSL